MRNATTRRTLGAALVVACALSVCGPSVAQAQTVDLSGVKYPPTLQVGDRPLLLNGAGIRYRFVVKVYTAGLYLGAKATTPEQVFAMAGPKRLHVVMLRDIDGEQLGRLFTRGMEDNVSKADFVKSIPGTLRIGELFAAKKRLAAGESFGVDWLPGIGTQAMLNGKPFGEPVREPEFFAAVLSIWLGRKPADAQLKEALLGQEPRVPGQN